MPYETFEYTQNSYDVGEGLTRYFTGMEQVWLRSEFMNSNGCAGIFYWDMGNDTRDCNDPRSLATFASLAINSNVQKIVEKVDAAAEAPGEYEYEESATEYYRIRGAGDGHTTHYLYQNGDELFAGDKSGEVRSIFCLEEAPESNAFYLKANDGRYIQDRSELPTKQSTYRFGKTPVSYSIKGEEYSYPNGEYCLEQTYYTPGKPDFTDVQRCLKCNGNNEGVSTWGPWTAASHWAIEPVYGCDIYTVTLTGIETVTCLKPGYTGSNRIYDGGFIALAAGEEITAGDIAASDGSEITVTIDKEGKGINITAGAVSGIEDAKEGTQQAVVYDLAGRRVQRITDRGIYIVGGKKQIKR